MSNTSLGMVSMFNRKNKWYFDNTRLVIKVKWYINNNNEYIDIFLSNICCINN
jgi:hypothetical protein